MHNDLFNNAKSVNALDTQLINTDTVTVGEIVDTQDFDSGYLTLKLGVRTTGDLIITSIEESDDSGMAGATVIPVARLQGTFALLAATNARDEIGFITTKQFVRANFTSANTASLTAGADVTLGNPNTASVR